MIFQKQMQQSDSFGPSASNLDPKMMTPPKKTKELIDKLFEISKEIENRQKEINRLAYKQESYMFQEKQLLDLQSQHALHSEEFKNHLKAIFQKLIGSEQHDYFRFNNRFYRKDVQFAESFKEAALQMNLNFTVDRFENITVSKPDRVIDSSPYIRSAQVRAPIEDDSAIKAQVEAKVCDLPPCDIENMAIHCAEEPLTINFQFLCPDDNGCPIDEYKICILSLNEVENTQFMGYREQIVGQFYQAGKLVTRQLKFTRKNPKEYQLPLQSMLHVQAFAHNKNGWSNQTKIYPLKLFCKAISPSTLFAQGLVPFEIKDFFAPQNQQELQNIDNKIYFRLTTPQPFALETGAILQMSTPNFRQFAIVNDSFQASSWGQSILFSDDQEESFQVDLKTDIHAVGPYHIDTNLAITKIACGFHHTLACTVDGQLLSWGLNDFGQLGNGTTQSRILPQPLFYFKNQGKNTFVIDVQAGKRISMCRMDNGEVYCWGRQQNPYHVGNLKVLNRFQDTINYQCLDGKNSQLSPRKIDLIAKQIVIGGKTFAAVSTDGFLYMWGSNKKQIMEIQNHEVLEGQCILHLLNPVQLQIPQRVLQVQIGSYHVICQLVAQKAGQPQGDFVSWGWNSYGQCGQRQGFNLQSSEASCSYRSINSNLPQSEILFFIAGEICTLFVTQDSSVYGFGQITQDGNCDWRIKKLNFEGVRVKELQMEEKQFEVKSILATTFSTLMLCSSGEDNN